MHDEVANTFANMAAEGNEELEDELNALLEEDANAEAEAMSERAAQGAKEDAAKAVPYSPNLRYHEKIKLLDRDGKPIGYSTDL